MLDADIDLNEGRRKRQRTTSPEPKPSVPREPGKNESAGQLKAAALGTNPPSSNAAGSMLNAKTDVDHQEARGYKTENQSSHKDADISTFLSTFREGHPTTQSGLVMDIATRTEKREATPPKKMLKVRPDGKLGSPKSQSTVTISKLRGRKRTSKTDEFSRTSLVVALRYGNDEESRRSLGKRITGILSGLSEQSGSIIVKASSEGSRLHEAPKTTHPFFLGAATRNAMQQDAAPKDDEKKDIITSDPKTQQNKRMSPTKARVTSKPAGLMNMSDAMPSFGYPTFGTDHAKVTRFPGAREPIWPPHGMLHVGRSTDRIEPPIRACLLPANRRKLKHAEIQIPVLEDVLRPYVDLARLHRTDKRAIQNIMSRDFRQFRRPVRQTMTGRELQEAIRPNIASKLPDTVFEGRDEDELSSSSHCQAPAHSALLNVYEKILKTRTAFDKSECETQEWAHKYAPRCAIDVLQQGREALMLRDWLKSLTVSSVESRDEKSRTGNPSVALRRNGSKTRKKKPRRAEGLEGFVVSSDEEADRMSEITDSEDVMDPSSLSKKSVIRAAYTVGNPGDRERATNAVVISGPHGCGKTAAVYAVAQELGFEIFEINAGSRRSGKDILDKVGDMTRNHLVGHGQGTDLADVNDQAEDLERLGEKLQEEIQSRRQGTMKSFFQSKDASKKAELISKAKAKKSPKQSNPIPVQQKKQQNQKQSLVLLEEVDVLFEEDKMFWATTLDLLVKSKRPVIMTCKDESLLPLDDIALHAIFRFTPPPNSVATDYLLLVACNEGHLLSRHAVSQLYKAKSSDLRASFAELNFFCQMAVGDRKGGLEWMLISSDSNASHGNKGEPLRVVSESTYCDGLGWIGGETPTSEHQQTLDEQTEFIKDVWNRWGLDLGATQEHYSPKRSNLGNESSRIEIYKQLQNLDRTLDTLSAVDILPSFVIRGEDMTAMDPTEPEVTEKLRSSYVEGAILLQANPATDQSGLASSLALALRACARRSTYGDCEHSLAPMSDRMALDMVPQVVQASDTQRPITKSSLSVAFDAIARSSKAVLGIPKGPQISVFDGPLSVIAADVAPYVRSIVSYDLRLEEQRRQLSCLLSQPEREGKSIRTTRASRAALEGGSKANTRRERWFPASTNFEAVLQSGEKGWQDVMLQRARAEMEENLPGQEGDGSRRSSLGSVSALENDMI